MGEVMGLELALPRDGADGCGRIVVTGKKLLQYFYWQ